MWLRVISGQESEGVDRQEILHSSARSLNTTRVIVEGATSITYHIQGGREAVVGLSRTSHIKPYRTLVVLIELEGGS